MSPTRFAILCHPRTGSNYLCSLLNSHGDVLCHSEVFNDQAIFWALGYRDGRLDHLGDVATRDADPAAFLERVWSEDFGHGAVGIKLLVDQARDLWPRMVSDERVHKIVLWRRNHVRTYLSLLRARATGHYAHESYDGLRVRVDPAALVAWAGDYDLFYQRLRATLAGQPWTDVNYEELVRDPAVGTRVLAFLGIDAQPGDAQSKLSKQSNDTLRDAIENFDELSQALAGTRFRHELWETGPQTLRRPA